jgi:hypothetical protein
MTELPAELMLAAVERATRHDLHGGPDVGWGRVVEHLGFTRSGWTTRRLRPQAEALEAAGLLVRSNRQGFPHWGLTEKGRRRLQRARRAGKVGPLPEAPQHRAWREARVLAAERMSDFRQSARDALREATRLLDADCDSGTWHGLSERLRSEFDRIGSATFCLREWPEPDDAHADPLEHLRKAQPMRTVAR